uniref:Uncharacterized protein n=1 Tax=Salix viminalis TaxID=40686 RepID=A0A6N2M909_SALVM
MSAGFQNNSAGGAFGGNRGLGPEKKDFLDCLKSSGHQSEFSKKYLEWRVEKQVYWRQGKKLWRSWIDMPADLSYSSHSHSIFVSKNLMAKQEMSELGFGNGCFRSYLPCLLLHLLHHESRSDDENIEFTRIMWVLHESAASFSQEVESLKLAGRGAELA